MASLSLSSSAAAARAPQPPPPDRLPREIGRWSAVALVINITIGAGIFGLPSKLYALVGSYSLLVYLLCAALIGLIALCFAEVGSRFPETGGPYVYAHEAFGPAVGFGIGWLLWVRGLFAFAALGNLFVTYLDHLWPGAGHWRAAVLTGLILALNVLNLRGVRQSARFSDVVTVGKLTPLVLFVFAGAVAAPARALEFGPRPAQQAFATAALLLIFAFQGFERVLVLSGEVREVRRNVPFALFTALGALSILYVAIQLVCILSLPDLARSERPLADASRLLLGAAGASGIVVGALLSLLGSLTITALALPRLVFAMSARRQLPGFLSSVHPRFRTPHVAILVSTGFTLVVSLASTFLSALTLASLIIVLVYAVSCAALPVLRRKRGAPAGFRVPGGTAVAAVSFALCLWLMSGSTAAELLGVGVAAAIGAVVYLAGRLGGGGRLASRRESR
jgi:amino acid transporter